MTLDDEIRTGIVELWGKNPWIAEAIERQYPAVFAALAHPELGPVDAEDDDVWAAADAVSEALAEIRDAQ